MMSFILLFASFPVISLVADARGSVDRVVYAAIGGQLVISMMTGLSYGPYSLLDLSTVRHFDHP
jgi:hypothetical protein